MNFWCNSILKLISLEMLLNVHEMSFQSNHVYLRIYVSALQKCAGIVWKELNNIEFLQKKEENDNKQEVNIYLMN